MSITQLPPDILRLIISKLSLHSILNLTETSSFFFRLIFDETCYRILTLRDLTLYPNLHLDYFGIVRYTHNLDPNDLLEFAAKYGFDRLAKRAIALGADEFSLPILAAGHGGYRKILEEIFGVSRDLNKLNLALVSVISGYHPELTNWLIQLGANDFNRAMSAAAVIGDLSTVEEMIRLGSNDFEGVLIDAAYGGNFKIIQRMLDLGATNLNGALIATTSHGHLEAVKQLINLGANDLNGGLRTAATHGHFTTVKYLIENGANDIKSAIKLSTIYNKQMIKNYLLSLS